MASSVNSLLGSSAATASTSSSASSTGLGSTTPSEGVFLQLLVSQLKNQDPLNPTDSTTFVTQLAQFSQLEQTIAIRTDADTIAAGVQSTSSTATGTGTGTGTGTTTTTGTTNSSTTGTN